jgi:hypothetical protein
MSHLNFKNKKLSKTAIGIAMCAFSVALVSGVGLGSWVLSGGVFNVAGPAVNVGDLINVDGSFFLDSNQGDNGSGVSNLQYCSTGLVYDEEIGSKGNLKYYFYLDVATFHQKVSWTSVSFSFTLLYKTYQAAYTIINSSTTAELKYLANSAKTYTSSSAIAGTMTTSLNGHDMISSITLPVDSASSYLHFELNYIFTASDVTTVLNNECKAAGPLFNLSLSVAEGVGA